MLRPEFVKKHENHLSSDALSNWQSTDPNEKEMNNHVIKATYALEQRVAEFANYLNDKEISKKFSEVALESAKHPVFSAVSVQDSVIRELHSRGINIRYIGRIVLIMEEKKIQLMIDFLVSLMLAR